MSDTAPVQTDKSRWLQVATWQSIAAAVTATAAKMAPFIIAFAGAAQAQQFSDACGFIAGAVLGLGGLLVGLSGAIEVAHHWWSPPPAAAILEKTFPAGGGK